MTILGLARVVITLASEHRLMMREKWPVKPGQCVRAQQTWHLSETSGSPMQRTIKQTGPQGSLGGRFNAIKSSYAEIFGVRLDFQRKTSTSALNRPGRQIDGWTECRSEVTIHPSLNLVLDAAPADTKMPHIWCCPSGLCGST